MPENEKTACDSCGAEAVEFLECEECGMALCRDCAVEVAGRNLCYRCKGEIVREMEKGEENLPSRRFRAKGIRPQTIFLLSLLIFIAFFAAVHPAMVIVVMMVFFVIVFFGSVAVLVSDRIKKVFYASEVWIDEKFAYGMTTSLTLAKMKWSDAKEIRIEQNRITIVADRSLVIRGRFVDFEEMARLVREIAAARSIKIVESVIF